MVKPRPMGPSQKIDLGAVQVQGHLLLGYHGYPMLFVAGINPRVEIGGKSKRVLQARAAAAGDAHPQHRPFFDLLIRHVSFDFSGRGLGQCNCHELN